MGSQTVGRRSLELATDVIMRKNSHYHHLRNKWVEKNDFLHRELVTKHRDLSKSDRFKQHLIGGLMLVSTPFIAPGAVFADAAPPVPVPTPVQTQITAGSKEELVALLKKKLPGEVRPLATNEEQDVTAILSANLRVQVAPQLQGIRLDRSYGLIGQEQHLPRYPGDSMDDHFATAQEVTSFASYGMTPGRGAWGYFANSRSELTKVDREREKYYIAVQTFLAPGWNENFAKYRDFFKYRKMLVVNPENGKAIVADIADAGPGVSTGKHLGGSPEVMKYLERYDGAQRGPVLYFFVTDESDTIPLGPISL